MNVRALLFGVLVAASFAAGLEAREPATGRAFALVNGHSIVVYTYRPRGCAKPGLLFVFAGYNRDADRYRDRARPLADRACLVVMAPLLDRERFPNWRYHRAGVVRGGRVQPREEWTGPVIAALVKWAREQEGRSDAPYYLFGHSAGAQLLSRLTAYSPLDGAARVVIANPSVHVLPSLSEAAPYGFKGVFDDGQGEAALRDYLARSVTIYLGTRDTGGKLLVKSDAAMRQGRTRYERGRNVFQIARALAVKHGWPFNWRLVEAPGVGHSSSRMLKAAQALDALGLRQFEPVR